MTGDAALRLGHFFGTTPEFWMNLQKLYELRLAENKSGKAIKDLPMLTKRRRKTHRLTASADVKKRVVVIVGMVEGHLLYVSPRNSSYGKRKEQ